MKALTLWQPWATLIATGKKQIETRSWPTRYRGPLAIHAGKHKIKEASLRQLCAVANLDSSDGWWQEANLRGVVLAYCELVDCVLIRSEDDWPDEYERRLGDYTIGRYMWKLADVKLVVEPVPVKGRQGLWEWSMEEVQPFATRLLPLRWHRIFGREREMEADNRGEREGETESETESEGAWLP